jgi:hypothetical protein
MMIESTSQAATRRPITAVGSPAGSVGRYDGSVAGYGYEDVTPRVYHPLGHRSS